MNGTRHSATGLSGGDWVRAYAIAGFVAFVTAFHAPLDDRITDLFHEGEYLAPRLALAAGGENPLLIHGQINYIPAQLAAALCGPDSIVACTRALNSGLTLTATLLLFACAFAHARTREALLFSLLIVAGFLFTLNARLFTPVGIHQGSPSVRDVPLLAVVCCLLWVPRCRGLRGDLLAGVAGLIAGLTCFWAYNRGLAGLLVIPLYSFVSLISGQIRRRVLLPLLGLAAGVAVATAAGPDMARQHVANIIYWAGSSAGIWRFEPSFDRITTNIPFYAILAGIVAAALHRAWRVWRKKDGGDALPLLLVLVAIIVLVTQQSWNRDDSIHLMWVVPWLLILVLQLVDGTGKWLQGNAGWNEVVHRHALLSGSIAALLLLDFFSTVSIVKPMLESSFRNLTLLSGQGRPRDRDLLSPGQAKVVRALRETGQPCTYVFNNGGAFYHLAGQRSCSAIMYPVYASPEAQRRVIADIAKARPLLVVGLSDDKFSYIDDRTLAMRTPLIAAWLNRHYPVVERFEGTELRQLAASGQPANAAARQ